jgi:hypothetical protein
MLHLGKWSLVHLKAYGHTYQFYLNHYFIWRKLLNIAVVQNIEVMLGQTENHFV